MKKKIASLLLLSPILSSCNVQSVLTAWLTPQPTEHVSPPAHSQTNAELHAEFLRELFLVVLERQPHNQQEFLKYMNALYQGASYEGVYNGVVYSREYRNKEVGTAAPVRSIKLFAEIQGTLLLNQKYDPLKIKNPAVPDVPTNIVSSPPQPTDQERTDILARMDQEALGKSLSTLKRLLGEEILKTIDLKKEYREKLAAWYGRFTVFLNKKNLDFSIPQRNIQDEYFHYKWALQASEDRIKWECLNRIHRLMNEASQN